MSTSHEKFMSLYSAHSDAIFRFCYSRTNQREVALDITQETFLKFWNVLARGDTIDNDRALLFTIARHLIIDWFRAKKTTSLESITEDEHVPEGAVIEAVSEDALTLENRADARFVAEKVSELEAPYREVVYLRFIKGLRPQEIAKRVGVSVNVVSVRIHRGVRALRVIAGYAVDTVEGVAKIPVKAAKVGIKVVKSVPKAVIKPVIKRRRKAEGII